MREDLYKDNDENFQSKSYPEIEGVESRDGNGPGDARFNLLSLTGARPSRCLL